MEKTDKVQTSNARGKLGKIQRNKIRDELKEARNQKALEYWQKGEKSKGIRHPHKRG